MTSEGQIHVYGSIYSDMPVMNDSHLSLTKQSKRVYRIQKVAMHVRIQLIPTTKPIQVLAYDMNPTACLQLFAYNRLPTTACLQLLAYNCLPNYFPTTVCLQLLASMP